MTPDQWQELAANALILGTGVGAAMLKRKKQNSVLAEALAEEVVLIRNEVTKISREVETVKTVIAVHKEDLRENTRKSAILSSDVAKLQNILPEIQDIMQKVLSYFERKKATPLEETSLKGGMTAIKTKKESDR